VTWNFRAIRRTFRAVGTRGAVRTWWKLGAIRTWRTSDTRRSVRTRRQVLRAIGPWRPALTALVGGTRGAGARCADRSGCPTPVAVTPITPRLRPLRLTVRVCLGWADGRWFVVATRISARNGRRTEVTEDGHALGDDLAIAHDPADAHTGVGERQRCVLGYRHLKGPDAQAAGLDGTARVPLDVDACDPAVERQARTRRHRARRDTRPVPPTLDGDLISDMQRRRARGVHGDAGNR